MSRFVAIYLPEWSVNLAFKKNPQIKAKELLLTKENAKQSIVKRFSLSLKAKGVRHEMPLVLAKALAPEAQVLNFDAAGDLDSLTKLGKWCLRYTPRVGLDSEVLLASKYVNDKNVKLEKLSPLYNGLILDISGTFRIHGSAEQLLEKIEKELSRNKLNVRLAAAPTIGAAWALSRFAALNKVIIKDKASLKSILAPLSLAALRVPDETLLALNELGLNKIGDLYQIPVKKLLARFDLKLIERLDPLFGRSTELLKTVQLKKDFKEQCCFDPPLSNKTTIQRACTTSLTKLIKSLAAENNKALKFKINFIGRDKNANLIKLRRIISLNCSSANFKHISNILNPVIERLSHIALLEELSISARGVNSVKALQANYLESASVKPPDNALDELINNLSLTVGGEKVCYAKLFESYVPENSFSFTPLKENYSELINSKDKISTPIPAFNLPSYLLKKPKPIKALALLPDAPPARLSWNNSSYPIRQGIGPEIISNEWWQGVFGKQDKGNKEEREYFRVQDNKGRWLWVFRTKRSLKWFLHGAWI